MTTILPLTVLEGQGSPVHTYSHVAYDGMGRKLWDAPPVTEILPQNVSEADKKYCFYDPSGWLIMVVLPPVDDPYDDPDQGQTVHPIYRYYYDQNGNQTAILDPLGRATVFEYDHENRLTKKYMPYQVTFTGVDLSDSSYYSELEAEIYADLPAGQKFEQKWYDAFGRLEQEKDYKGQYTVYGYYDAQTMYDNGEFVGAPGQIMLADFYIGDPGIGDNLRSSILYTYDRLGRRTSETMIEYDLVSQVLTMTRQQSWSYTYDVDGNLTQILHTDYTDPQDPVTLSTLDYTYNPITGQKITTETGHSITGCGYDDLGRLESVSSQIWTGTQFQSRGTTVYGYNPNGSRASVTLPNDIFTEYTYNALNCLTNLTHYTSIQKTDSVSSYDYALAADGMRTQADEYIEKYSGTDEQAVDYGYDNLNRLESETVGTSYSVAYTYDLAGNRLTREVDAQNGILSTVYTYDPDTDRLLTEVHSGPIATVSWIKDRPVTLYASADGGTYYRLPYNSRKIGHVEAWFYGLPTVLNRYILISLAVITLAVLLGPSSVVLVRRLRRMPRAKRPHLSVVHRTLCLLLAWVFLVDTEVFQQTAYADSQYEQVSTFTWADGNHTIEYTYDDNGSLTSKVTTKPGDPDPVIVETVTYEYNLQNRLSRVTTIPYTEGTPGDPEVVEYRYNPGGIRVQKITSDLQTDYVIDPDNPTGYAQVLEEYTYDIANPSNPVLQSAVYYTLGDDVISQTKAEDVENTWTVHNTQYLLYDGHGSTRQLSGSSQTIQENYNYDGYGVLLQGSSAESDPGSTLQQDTSILYSGEMFEFHGQQYNNRSRWYNPMNGRFNRMDFYAGDIYNPQSLHKYLYVHNNPANFTDPSGYIVAEYKIEGVAISSAIQAELNNIDTVRVTSTSIVMHKTLTLAVMGMIALTAFTALTLELVCYQYLAYYVAELQTRTAQIIYKLLDTKQKLYKAAAQVLAAEALAIKHAGRIGLTEDQIRDLPIFFVFDSITHRIYENIMEAIGSNPWWLALEYVGSENSSIQRSNRDAALAGKGHLRTLKYPQLDEYPFASTYQGGAGSYVKSVSVDEHIIQRTHLSAFYNTKLKYKSGWFLVVPLPF